MADWLSAIRADQQMIDTDAVVGAYLLPEPDRIWSLSDVLLGLRGEHELADLADSIDALACAGFISVVAEVGCDDQHRDGFWGDGCTDATCRDVLFQLRLMG
ncbi:hypothetical protein [Mycolicibacterium obuense]|uniref:Uncharacterized protein n=1 Tax=Mycolicibacterium obuense TaxID=1807 RepID=A0A0J6Y784_9MYCO|nr:hypothetical protein [Mycolicibacterium obuense]KMO68906.1 hypothetical protein MOBUDSM44075_04326 [Mycolicibacterium obuense]